MDESFEELQRYLNRARVQARSGRPDAQHAAINNLRRMVTLAQDMADTLGEYIEQQEQDERN